MKPSITMSPIASTFGIKNGGKGKQGLFKTVYLAELTHTPEVFLQGAPKDP